MIHTESYTFDTWEATNSGLSVLRKSINLMCEQKPSQKDEPKLYKIWEDEMNELRRMCVTINYRRIALNQSRYKSC